MLEVLACRDTALLLRVGGFGAAVLGPLVTASLGVLVLVVLLETEGFAALWLPTGSVLLLGRSSGTTPAGAADGRRCRSFYSCANLNTGFTGLPFTQTTDMGSSWGHPGEVRACEASE